MTRINGPQYSPGNIYVVKAANGLYKIGMAVNVAKRLHEIRALSPVPVILVHAFRTECMLRTEQSLHKKFEATRDHGEWFRLDENQVKWLKSLDEQSSEDVVALSKRYLLGGLTSL